MFNEVKEELSSIINQNQELSEIDLLEQLSELEHKQWIYWSKGLVDSLILNDGLVEVANRLKEKWSPLWIEYSQLTEEMKNKDRKWGMEVIAVLKKNNIQT